MEIRPEDARRLISLGVREMAIGQVFQGMGAVDGGVAVGEQSRSMGMSTQLLSGIAAR